MGGNYMLDALVEGRLAEIERLEHKYQLQASELVERARALAAEIEKHVPGFTISYQVDPVRQAIADSWPRRIDDTAAREEWGWKPEYDLEAMTADMIAQLRART